MQEDSQTQPSVPETWFLFLPFLLIVLPNLDLLPCICQIQTSGLMCPPMSWKKGPGELWLPSPTGIQGGLVPGAPTDTKIGGCLSPLGQEAEYRRASISVNSASGDPSRIGWLLGCGAHGCKDQLCLEEGWGHWLLFTSQVVLDTAKASKT